MEEEHDLQNNLLRVELYSQSYGHSEGQVKHWLLPKNVSDPHFVHIGSLFVFNIQVLHPEPQ